MTAAIIAFPASGFVPQSAGQSSTREEQEAVRQARLIKQSERGPAMALVLALLSILPDDERVRVQLALEAAPNTPEIEEALAHIRYETADAASKARVAAMLACMGGGEA